MNYQLWIMNYELWIILLLRLTAQCARAQNSSRIAPMRRILSFSRIFFLRFTWSWIFLRIVFAPIGAGLLFSGFVVLWFGYFVVCKSLLQLSLSSFQQEIIRDNHCAQQAPTNPTTRNKNPWKNRSVASVLSVIDFEHGERDKGEWAYRVVLSSRQLSMNYW